MRKLLKSGMIGLLILCTTLSISMAVHAEDGDDEQPDVKSEVDVAAEGWDGDITQGNRCYVTSNGEKLTGLQTIESDNYYFDSNGYAQTGWQVLDGVEYYFHEDTGKMARDEEIQIEGKWYRFDAEGGSQCIDENNDNEEEEQITDEGDSATGLTNIMQQSGQVVDADAEENASVSTSTVLQSDQTTGWFTEDGKKYYAITAGTKHTGWLSFGSTYYYCGSDGALVTGIQNIAGVWYYFAENGDLDSTEYGKRTTGWIELDGKKYYGMPDGSLRVGWLSFGNTYYYCGSDAAVVTGVHVVNGIGYLFDEDGVRQSSTTGWIELDGKKYYGMSDGTMRVGWLSFGNTYYYCGSDGALVTGKQSIGGLWYYFAENEELSSTEYGKRTTGWIELDGKKYYGMPNGSLRVGWLSFGSTRYYCNSDGEVVTGIYVVDGIGYSFDEEGVCESAATGWIEKNGRKYYGMPDGTIRVGWLSFGSTYYYCGSDGALVTGKQSIGGLWYYFAENEELSSTEYGKRTTGWIELDGKKYYGMPDGSLRVGWLSFGSTRYYCGSDAAVVTGIYVVDGVGYLFGEDGVRQSAPSGWTEVDGKKYYGMPDGTYRVGWLSFGSTYYYCGSDAAIIQNCDYPVNGVLYTFDAEGVRQVKPGWGEYNGNKYYINPDTGFPYTGWVTFGSTWYYANSNGIMVSGWQKIGSYYYYFNPTTKIMARSTTIDGYKIGSDGRRITGNFLGIDRAAIVAELSQHEHDGYYLGTPYRGTWIGYPNGAPRGDGVSGFNCTGFVAYVFQKCGANLTPIIQEGGTGGIYNASNWWHYIRDNKTYYGFLTIDSLLSSGLAEKGDIIYCEPNWSWPGADCHIGIFWGDTPYQNRFWHSTLSGNNHISNIYSGTRVAIYYLVKVQ